MEPMFSVLYKLFKPYFLYGTVRYIYIFVRYHTVRVIILAREGWSVITVTDELKAKLEKIAKLECRSIPKTIEKLVNDKLCQLEA